MYDELKIYYGEDYVISKHIKIHQPTLSEICEYGEQEYYSMINQLTATPQSMKVQLWDKGIDYTTITPYILFYYLLHKLFPKEKTSIVFGALDFTKFIVTTENDTDDIVLYQEVDGDEVIINESIYNTIMNYLRQAHNIPKDERIPANETTKMVLIEDDREEIERRKNEPYHSQLKNLVSAMINSEGFKYSHNEVWNMRINAFMDSVKRISKIKNAELLLQSGYSGFGVNLKDVSNKQLNWLGELE